MLHPQASPKKWGIVPGNAHFVSSPLCPPTRDQCIHFLFSAWHCTVADYSHGAHLAQGVLHTQHLAFVACSDLCSELTGCTECVGIYEMITVEFSSLLLVNSHHQITDEIWL